MTVRAGTAVLTVVSVLVAGVLVAGCGGTPAGTAAPGDTSAATGTPSVEQTVGISATTAPTTASSKSPTPKATVTRSGRKIKVMVLGDSISAGAKDEVMNGYRLDLLKKLPAYAIDYVGSYERGDSRLADKDMQAEGGACIHATPCNSTSMYEQTAGWISAAQPEVVIMQGGGNDYCCGRNDQPDSVVIQAMTDWINLVFKTKPGVYIVVIGMTDYHDGYKNWLPTYVKSQAKAGKRISFVSYDGISTYDTVHPNVAGYQQLAGRIAPVVKPIFDKLLS
ncbi:GDSL-type esterase/lipase family protein [Hamadaea sp. NPDC051192]|uniref:SGNH/GDSL hydrolase family protein n=1 Tax=Hamadaea sp. NPDC051192 TaxID=3154940 RepID=UPI003431DA13